MQEAVHGGGRQVKEGINLLSLRASFASTGIYRYACMKQPIRHIPPFPADIHQLYQQDRVPRAAHLRQHSDPPGRRRHEPHARRRHARRPRPQGKRARRLEGHERQAERGRQGADGADPRGRGGCPAQAGSTCTPTE